MPLAISTAFGQQGTPPSPIPTDELRLWYDASAESYTNGQLVPSLTDQSGYGFDAVQANTNKQPTFVTSGINGQPSINFPGDTGVSTIKYLFVDGDAFEWVNALVPTDMDIFVVKQQAVDPSNSGKWGCWMFHGSMTNKQAFFNTNGDIWNNFGTRVRHKLAPPSTGDLVNPHIIRTQHTPIAAPNVHMDSTCYVGGVAKYTAGPFIATPEWARTSSVTVKKNCMIGASDISGTPGYEGNDWPMEGLIAEIIVYSKALTGPEFTTLKGYLNGKYGTIIP